MFPKQKKDETQHCPNVYQVQRENYFESRVTYKIIYQLTLRTNLDILDIDSRTQFATYTLFLEEKNLGMYVKKKIEYT